LNKPVQNYKKTYIYEDYNCRSYGENISAVARFISAHGAI